MGHNVTIGGNRLGSGGKMTAHLRDYERSNQDLSYLWRSTMACGTLVPFMSELALPGDTFDIDLNCEILTHPTIGPLFGKYKVQLDVFQVPIRLYQGKLHMNMLGIGMNMSDVKLPLLVLEGKELDRTKILDNQHVNPSCLLNYLGIKGIGHRDTATGTPLIRKFNAIPYLGYWDIYKNYYANKQEEIGVMIHKDISTPGAAILSATVTNGANSGTFPLTLTNPVVWDSVDLVNTNETNLDMTVSGLVAGYDAGNKVMVLIRWAHDPENPYFIPINQLWQTITIDVTAQTISGRDYYGANNVTMELGFIDATSTENPNGNADLPPELVEFPLENIDLMRQYILTNVTSTTALEADSNSILPFGGPLQKVGVYPNTVYAATYNQEGLAIKTYQSDLFNNWMDTEWIDGVDGINEVTKVDTSSGGFTIDELNMKKKVYDMLNRIAISGGSYDDWLDAVYTHDRQRTMENPVYLGGLIKDIVFDEVVSNSSSRHEGAKDENQPLGTLAGRGVMGQKNKGGSVKVRIDEPSYIMGIISITPIIDYSQGNKWDTNLKTMDDFHKPALDEIGFQELITDQMAFWDTKLDASNLVTFKSAGKQPAWVNYMTNINQVKGNFADEAQQMFMVLNRRYEHENIGSGTEVQIGDLTTYIDPRKFNHIFADTRLDAQNFWAQIGVSIFARRKMSGKTMPNL